MIYNIIYAIVFLYSIAQCHSVNNKQLLWVEPISSVKLDIATRSEIFFQKRDVSQNSHYQPNVRSLQYDDSLRLSVQAFNKTIYLHLTPNHDLFHPNAVFHQQGKSSPLNPSDFRVYRGHVIDDIYSDHWWISPAIEDMENQPGVLGWARIIVRNDIKHDLDYPLFEGTFNIYGDTHHVKLTENYHLTKRNDDAVLNNNNNESVRMIMYRDSDTVEKELTPSPTNGCGFDRLSHNPLLFNQKRDILTSNPFEIADPLAGIKRFDGSLDIGKTLLQRRAPQGCPTSKKILYMGAAADCTYVKFYQSQDAARMQIINDWNSVSSVYGSTFNVAIGLINITIMDSTCPTTPTTAARWNQQCSTGYGIDDRLSDFSQWRGAIGKDGAGLWHLMTNCATGVEVGLAWLSQVCNTAAEQSSNNNGQYTSGTGVSSIIRDEWKVVAHEIGHGFGAIHDCTSQNCPCSGSSCPCCPYSDSQCDAGGQYFMNPTSNATSDAFSPCSIKTVCGSMSNWLSCLEDPGTRNVTTLKMCGNGIKEDGEDCDTGGQPSNCCDPTTCKFKTGALCDDFNDLCCNNCQLRPANYTCRPASNECDIAEVCSGTSGNCPADKYKDDLTSCSNGMQCASGQCTSRDQQCVARGSTQGIQKSCGGDSSCQVICQSPQSALSCMIFPGNFVDGTPCGVGGVCSQGSCNTSNFGNNVANWINNNKQIVVPVAIVVGLLLLFCLFRCCCYGGRSGYNDIGKTTIYTVPQQSYPGQYGNAQPPYYPPPPSQNQQPPYYTPPPQGWVDPALYNGPNHHSGLQQPTPIYSLSDNTRNNNNNQHHDSYEMNNYNRNASPSIPHSPALHYQQIPSPSPAPANYPPPPQHGGYNSGNNGRLYQEGII